MTFLNKKDKISIPKDLRPITLITGWCKLTEILFIDRNVRRLDELNKY